MKFSITRPGRPCIKSEKAIEMRDRQQIGNAVHMHCIYRDNS